MHTIKDNDLLVVTDSGSSVIIIIIIIIIAQNNVARVRPLSRRGTRLKTTRQKLTRDGSHTVKRAGGTRGRVNEKGSKIARRKIGRATR